MEDKDSKKRKYTKYATRRKKLVSTKPSLTETKNKVSFPYSNTSSPLVPLSITSPLPITNITPLSPTPQSPLLPEIISGFDFGQTETEEQTPLGEEEFAANFTIPEFGEGWKCNYFLTPPKCLPSTDLDADSDIDTCRAKCVTSIDEPKLKKLIAEYYPGSVTPLETPRMPLHAFPSQRSNLHKESLIYLTNIESMRRFLSRVTGKDWSQLSDKNVLILWKTITDLFPSLLERCQASEIEPLLKYIPEWSIKDWNVVLPEGNKCLMDVCTTSNACRDNVLVEILNRLSESQKISLLSKKKDEVIQEQKVEPRKFRMLYEKAIDNELDKKDKIAKDRLLANLFLQRRTVWSDPHKLQRALSYVSDWPITLVIEALKDMKYPQVIGDEERFKQQLKLNKRGVIKFKAAGVPAAYYFDNS